MYYTPKNKNIDRRTNNIVHLKDGSIKYDFSKFNSYIAELRLIIWIVLQMNN